MSGDNLYVLTSLPALGELGAAPPISLAELVDKAAGNEASDIVLEALLLSDDLLQREAFLSGEIEQLEPAVLTIAQAQNEEPLPEYLEFNSREITTQNAVDTLWSTYYHHAVSVATKYNSDFLSKWVEYEVGLRNALVLARAKALNLDPQDYLVASDIGLAGDDFSGLISEWSAASDPIAGLRVLDSARWEWLCEHDAWFTFNNDELIAYGAKLMLIQRWYRLGQEQN